MSAKDTVWCKKPFHYYLDMNDRRAHFEITLRRGWSINLTMFPARITQTTKKRLVRATGEEPPAFLRKIMD